MHKLSLCVKYYGKLRVDHWLENWTGNAKVLGSRPATQVMRFYILQKLISNSPVIVSSSLTQEKCPEA